MPRDEEITFADHVGRFYARRFGYPPMVVSQGPPMRWDGMG